MRTLTPPRRSPRYDPYAPVNAEPPPPPAGENVYEKSKGLMAAARLTGGVEVDEDRGMWKGAGRLKGFSAPGRRARTHRRALAGRALADAALLPRSGVRPTRLAPPAPLPAPRCSQSQHRKQSACGRVKCGCLLHVALTRSARHRSEESDSELSDSESEERRRKKAAKKAKKAAKKAKRSARESSESGSESSGARRKRRRKEAKKHKKSSKSKSKRSKKDKGSSSSS